MNVLRMLVLALVLCASASQVRAQSFTNSSAILDSSGQATGGGVYSQIGGSGQPGGITSSAGGPFVNFAGFFNTFALRPKLDTDRDGLANEFDLDNDNDGLTDIAELTGSAFVPTTLTDVNNPDSDVDWFSDGEEAAAGTDPTSLASLLKITSIRSTTNGVVVGWIARSNSTYQVKRGSTLAGGGAFTGTLATVTAQGPASPPWYGLTNYFTDTNTPAGKAAFYRIDTAAP
jgi:hypothetical protein